MRDCFILLCAGKSKRFKSKLSKQFFIHKNKPLFEYSLKTAVDSNLFKKILIVSDRKIKKINYKKYLNKFKNENASLKRLPTHQEVADLCYYLSSNESSAITGQNINIDCGVFPQ